MILTDLISCAKYLSLDCLSIQGDTDKSGKKKKALYLTSFKLSALRWSCIDNKAQSHGPFVKYSQNVSYLVDYMVIILFFIYLTFLYYPL